MFTGIVAELGTVDRLEAGEGGARLRVRAALASGLSDGDSVAVNGVCLTAAATDRRAFEADVMNQTLERTSLGPLEPGRRVNLELPLRPTDRLGGHLVQGHVDGTGVVADVAEDGVARRVGIEVGEELWPYMVERGSIAVDGVSLTVLRMTERGFEVSLIPETLERTTLGEAEEGRVVNVEVDVVARYVGRLLRFAEKGGE